MKRVCIFSAQYFPTVGGVERYTYYIAQQLKNRGIDVTIVTSKVPGTVSYEKQEGITIYRFPCFNLMNGRFPTVKFNKETKRILKKLGEKQYDLVITNTRFYLHSLVGVRFGKKNAKRSIVIEHGTSHLSVHNPILDFCERIFEHTITFLVKCNCREFYGVSEACLEWLKHFHIKGKSVLYNAIDIHQISELMKNSDTGFREKHHIYENGTMIAFTGRLIKEKGVLELKEAFHRILKEYPDTYLVMAGDGVLKQELQKNASDHMILLGQVDFKQIVNLLKQSEIFCLPSVSEGMPTSVLEAIACHNFIITTERGGAKEIIADDTYGIILKDNSVQNVETALKRVLKDTEYRKEAEKKSYQKLIEEFTWERVADKIEKNFL